MAGLSIVDHKTITGTTPALAAGTANDLIVTNTDGTDGTLVKGFVSDFTDVTGGTFYPFVTTLVSNGITAGVGGGLYGVNQSTVRQQMAVFLLKAKYGLCYVPPACTGTFADVPCPSTFASLDRGSRRPRASPAAAAAATTARSTPCAATRWPSSC